MLTFSKNQLSDRWDNLPMPLREAMYAPEVSDALWKICGVEHLSDEKTFMVARVVGFVFMGLLAVDQAAKEIADELGIDIRIATSIANAIDQQIFSPLRADIDKVYSPIIGATITPKIFEEIHPPIAELVPTSTQTSAPAPATLPASIPAAVPPPAKQEPIKPAVQRTTTLDEFARIGKNTGSVSAPAPAPVPAPAPAPKPVFLQTESISRPIPNAPDFRVPTISKNIMSGGKGTSQLPARAAFIEFGGMPVPKPATAPQPPIAPRVSVVRYGSENSTAPAMPPKPEPARTITEITSGTLKTAAPAPTNAPTRPSFTPISQIPVPSPTTPKPQNPAVSTSSTPPAPPKPMPQAPKPAGQPEKVVIKDYSEAENSK